MKLMQKNANLLPELPRLFDDFFTKDFFDWGFRNFSSTGTSLPAVNIVESKDEYIVEMAAPGMTKKDFQIELKDNTLTISSEYQESSEPTQGDNWLRREFSYQSFRRSFTLNNRVVDEAHIKATYQDGILRLTLPKKEEAKAKAPRTIQIS